MQSTQTGEWREGEVACPQCGAESRWSAGDVASGVSHVTLLCKNCGPISLTRTQLSDLQESWDARE